MRNTSLHYILWKKEKYAKLFQIFNQNGFRTRPKYESFSSVGRVYYPSDLTVPQGVSINKLIVQKKNNPKPSS